VAKATRNGSPSLPIGATNRLKTCLTRIEYVLGNANTPDADPQVFVAYGGYLAAAKAFRDKAEKEE
jgi:hypothetical protein